MDQEQSIDQSEQTSKPDNKVKNELIEWAKAIGIAVVLVVVIRWFVFAPFIVDGPSMEPNFETGERLIVNKLLYDFRMPQRGEVVVFHVPDEGRDFIKRVIGLPGDTVKVEGDDVYVNGEKVNEYYIQDAIEQSNQEGRLYNSYLNFPNGEVPDGTVPEGKIFVMGDNRSNSKDSRSIGYVDIKEVVGRADLIFWPIQKVTIVKH
ncbi:MULTISPECIES: signal peptidase I [unclassified Paenibacillus]|uniref:signal peptidase I n=1 Tax=unclassified Paenibacillus TaxID=185978 RepID=UPI001C1255EB|nr:MULTISPECIES: signal peptidase I [unclassified Paenibacillus]MBU5441737.1 signal peptidase I [Paenibacillus sp. MSJ-34]CAH0122128.1 Signal peptidase I S [Paenibacillus sp. CECT 9249]